MEKQNAVAVLEALSEATRLETMKLLVEAGVEGLPAGAIARRLNRIPGSMTFHFRQLCAAGLLSQRRCGRQIVYRAERAAIGDLVEYLLENCCGHGMRSDQTELLCSSARHESKPA